MWMKPVLARAAMPFGLAAALFAALLLLLIRHGLHQDAGIFVYPLDDAYIHLAVARNFALHGVWGITPYAFSGASSSPAWTLLLAAVTKIAGVHLLAPLVLNVAAALCLLLLISLLLASMLPAATTADRTIALCLVVLVVPLPGLALIGMEHVLHSVAVISLVALAALILSSEARNALRGQQLDRTLSPSLSRTIAPKVSLMLAALACGALRYDSCFVILAVTGLLLAHRRLLLAIGVCAASAIGPIVYGLYSYRQSGILLPFSVVMKSAGAVSRQPFAVLVSSDVSPLLLLLTVALLLRLAHHSAGSAAELQEQPKERRPSLWSFSFSFLVIALATTVMHAELGPAGWLMRYVRYEGYLYALDLTALALTVGEGSHSLLRGLTPTRRLVSLAMLVALLPAGVELLHRAHHGWADIAASIHDRYVEHLPQALFVAQQMPHAVVIANDIGFLAYYADQVKILDPLGLGSLEPVVLVRQHRLISPQYVAQWAADRHAQLAILHTDFPGMQSMIPAKWILVESWCFPHNTVFLNHVQSFYVPDLQSAVVVRTQMAQFHSLDPEVVRYRFPQDGAQPPSPERGESVTCPAPPGN